MKFSHTSSLVPIFLAASAAAAPRHAARADFDVSNLPAIEETVNQMFDAQHHERQKRDGVRAPSDLPTVEDTVDQMFAVQDTISRRADDKPLKEAVDNVMKDKAVVEGVENQVWGHEAIFPCQDGGDSKKVSPRWLTDQVLNKVAYLTQNEVDLPYRPKSNSFKGDVAGLDWTGNQDGQQGTHKHDWVKMTLAWSQFGSDDSHITNSMVKELVLKGINVCQKDEKDEGLRTRGFAAKWNGQWVFYLRASNIDNKQAENDAGDRKWLKWQTPAQSTTYQWDTFLRNHEIIANPTIVPPA